MKKTIHVALSPLSNRIYAGHVLKDGRTWASNKSEVTGEACAAVAQLALALKMPIVVSNNGKPCYEIHVKKIGGEIAEEIDKAMADAESEWRNKP